MSGTDSIITKIRVFLALLAGKAVKAFCRIVKKGGTAMPGRFALKIYPELLAYLARDVKTVVVTGTNGKTTSCRMVEEAFSQAGLNWFSNPSGANLIVGIVTDFMSNCTLTGKMNREYAVIECDEAASKKVFAQLQPRVIFVTNLFNDQLDRFGTVRNTLENIRIGIAGAPGAVLCLNGDEPLSASLAENVPNPVVFYGVNQFADNFGNSAPDTDEAKCVHCDEAYEYSYVTYAHLGGFRCPRCGYERKPAEYSVTELVSMGADSSTVTLSTPSGERRITINLPAMYNVYNAAGAMAAVCELGLSPDIGVSALEAFKCGFGRMEKFPLGQKGSMMVLVKNTAGCNQVIEFLHGVKEEHTLVMYFNSRINDGTDFSWIGQANLEKLAEGSDRIRHIYISGESVAPLHKRLLQAGFAEDKLSEVADDEALADIIEKQEVPVFILPSYSAMLEFRGTIVKRTGGKDFFEL